MDRFVGVSGVYKVGDPKLLPYMQQIFDLMFNFKIHYSETKIEAIQVEITNLIYVFLVLNICILTSYFYLDNIINNINQKQWQN